MTILIAMGCALARWWRGVALAALTVPVASGLTEGVLKPVIGRTIDGALSLPSGHTTAGFTLATLVAVLLSRRLPAPARGLVILAAYVLAVAVAAAMIAQGFHYFTDTIAGAAVGTATVLIGALVIDAAAGPLGARIGVPAGDSPQARCSGPLRPGAVPQSVDEERDHALAVGDSLARHGQAQVGDGLQEVLGADAGPDLAAGCRGFEQ